LVRPDGWLALMTTQAELAAVKAAAGDGFDWQEPVPLPGSGQRIVVLAHLLDK